MTPPAIRGDHHYTPQPLAEALVSSLDLNHLSNPVVADFAAGTGALLDAVVHRFHAARCIATDVDKLAVARLRAAHPTWRIGRCNFLDPRSVAHSPLANPNTTVLDAVVLNPPFSCRGSHRVTVHVQGTNVGSSVAMAFVLRAFEFLSPHGQLAALLPAGCLAGQKDEEAWALLHRQAVVTVLKEYGHGEFKGAFARTVLVHLRQRSTPESPKCNGSTLESNGDPLKGELTLYRGRFPVHRAVSSIRGFRFVHTTQLREGSVARVAQRYGPKAMGLKGPLLLLPRVGLPSPQKIALYRARQNIVVSDCIFAVSGCLSLLEDIQRKILHRWDLFRSRYGGSCAPYITTRRLLRFLEELGADIQPEPRLQKAVKEPSFAIAVTGARGGRSTTPA